MTFVSHRKYFRFSFYPIRSSLRLVLTVAFLLPFFWQPVTSQFRLLRMKPLVQQTASELSKLFDTISSSVKKEETSSKNGPETVFSSGSPTTKTAARLNSKMHAPTPQVTEIQKASSGILQVTKILAGIARQAPEFITLPFLNRLAGNLDILKGIQPDDVRHVLQKFNVSVPAKADDDRMQSTDVPCDVDVPYRTANGSCNNLLHPCWGMATEDYARWLPPDYKNDLDTPRARRNGKDLPNPRSLATVLSSEGDSENPVSEMTSISTIWGQFISHDIVLTPTFVQIPDGENSEKKDFTDLNCCGVDLNNPECFSIIVEDGDPFFPKGYCLDFVRSTAHVFNPKGCEQLRLGLPRNQLNQVTSFIDASTVYGSSENVMRSLREDNGRGARLKVFDGGSAHILLRNNQTCRSFSHSCDSKCLLTGEQRATETPGLASLHTLWVREHNRIAKILQSKGWDQETVFQETRKIIIAMVQHITFNEFLPQIIGSEKMFFSGLNTSFLKYVYNPTINPTIMNSFAASAFRFGHSMVRGRESTTSGNRHHLVRDMFSVDEFCNLSSDPVQRLISGHSQQRSQKVDNWFAKELTNQLFADDVTQSGLDLLSFNIQRGRDHGLPPYNLWREHCGLTRVETFNDLNGWIPEELLRKLRIIYGDDSVHDIDLYVAGVSELPLKGASIGPTFACIVIEQFRRLKFGDRFWYENLNHAGAFTEEQLLSIKKTRLSEIICRNVKIPKIQRNVFLINSNDNPLESCSTILTEKSVDWDLW